MPALPTLKEIRAHLRQVPPGEHYIVVPTNCEGQWPGWFGTELQRVYPYAFRIYQKVCAKEVTLDRANLVLTGVAVPPVAEEVEEAEEAEEGRTPTSIAVRTNSLIGRCLVITREGTGWRPGRAEPNYHNANIVCLFVRVPVQDDGADTRLATRSALKAFHYILRGMNPKPEAGSLTSVFTPWWRIDREGHVMEVVVKEFRKAVRVKTKFKLTVFNFAA